MNDDKKRDVALFRLAVLGDLVHTELRRGALRRALEKKSQEQWLFPDGKTRPLAAKTIQSWLYTYRKSGFDGLLPRDRKDRGSCRSIPLEIQALVLDMKREDPGRSTPLILRELENAGVMRKGDFSASAVTRLLARHGLSGPKMELEVAARHRFVAATCGELWQGDACHGPKLFDPEAGREVRVKIFGLLDDKSRLIAYLRGSFFEVPAHLRGGKVTLYYEVLRPGLLWLVDGNTRVPVREVDAVANSRRSRQRKTETPEVPRATGLNAVEGTLKRLLHPGSCGDSAASHVDDDELEGGAACVR